MDIDAAQRVDVEGRSSCTPLAVFDFDGTCISGQSGLLLSQYLFRNGYIGLHCIAGLSWWGMRYKLHAPYRQERPRELMFSELCAYPPSEITTVMAAFHDEVLLPRYRPTAAVEIARRKECGCVTLLVSATYDEIATIAVRHLGVDGHLATKMARDDAGFYRASVDGLVIAGREKLRAVVAWADEHLGRNQWCLAAAYGDHYTDIPLLASAMESLVVCPSHTLAVEARQRGWRRLDWSII